MDNLYELVARHARESGTKVAVCKPTPGGGVVETTYADLCRMARCLAPLWARLTPAGAWVPMLTGKSASSIACMLGAIAAERPFCFLNSKYRGPQIAAVLEAADASLCVTDGTGLVALRGTWIDHPRIARTRWLIVSGEPLTGVYAQALEQLRAVADVSIVGEDTPLEPPSRSAAPPRPDVPGTCLFTSGSTGEPKGVLISEADLMQRAATEIGWFGLGPDDVLLSILPFSFDVGLNQLFTALAVGGELVLLDSWLPADITAIVERRRVTGISGVPAIWQDLIHSGGGFDTQGRHASLRYVTISGGSLSREYLQKLPAVVGRAGIFKTYGQTEAFRATSLRPEDYQGKLDSVGTPFPGVHVYIVRDDGVRCDAGEIGEVVHTGLGVMLGYLGSSQRPEVANKLRPNPFRGADDPAPVAVFTGDLGYVDADGYLYLKGRRDSMLKVMGNRVYPQEVTTQLLTLPGVRDAVVAGVSREDGQTVLVAFVAAAPATELTAGAVRKGLNTRLPAFMVPREIVFVEHIPRTPSGKPDQRRLMQRYGASVEPEVPRVHP
jgi:acyl-CoA synthetase (AMP-forming)/AMP-acid ligase II